jgi:transporter family-2 protein
MYGTIIVLIVIAGCGNAIQAPTLSLLSSSTGSMEASLVNFIGGLLLATAYVLVSQRGRIQSMKGSRPWQYLGGMYGTIIVLIVIAVTPTLGVGLLVACQMLGQLTGGMIIDARGWLGCARIPVSTWRVSGVLFVAAGVFAIALC